MSVNKTIYLDNAASTAVFPEIIEDIHQLMKEHYANAESLHEAGLKIQTMMKKSREALAKMLNVKAGDLYFTSGATESNNLLIKGIALANQKRGKHLITTQVEHSSVIGTFQDLETFFGFEVTYLPVDIEGRVSLESLRGALREDTILVSIMAVNNEVGTVMPIEAMAELVHEHSKAYFHVDMVQALAKSPVNLMKVDCASFSAHKIHGTKGSGLAYCKSSVNIHPLITGGQQENGFRPGTLNAINCIVFAKTLRLATEGYQKRHEELVKMNVYLREELSKIDGIIVNSPEKDCSVTILNFSCLKLPSQVMLNYLSQNHIYVSAMATCLNRDVQPSHVLSAMGVDQERIQGVIRVSMGLFTVQSDLEVFVRTIRKGIERYGKS